MSVGRRGFLLGACALPVLPAWADCAGKGRAERMRSALSAGFGVQYWGTDFDTDHLAEAPHGLLILEATKIGAKDSSSGREKRFTRQEIARIRREGRPVLAYLNITEIEEWRDYGSADPNDLAAAQLPDGGLLALWWEEEWQRILLARARDLMALGVDGLFLDDALHYWTTGQISGLDEGAPADVPEAARLLMRLVLRLTESVGAADCEALCVVNNAIFVGRDAGEAGLFDQYRTAIDGVLIEDALGGADHPDLHAALSEDYLAHAVPVLSIDLEAPGQAQAARTRGYVPYLVPDTDFSRLAPPVTP